VNAESVAGWLEAIGVPPQVVSIGAEADDAWCLLREDAGPDSDREPEWEVFWREQGNRYEWARFTNEQVACFYLFGRLAWTQVASGVLRAPDLTEPQR
jgi:hypothetical protein